MRVIASAVRAFVVLLAALPALSQVELGARPSCPPVFAAWLQGEPVPTAEEQAPKCRVYAFYTVAQSATRFVQEGDYFAALQRRWSERGVVVTAVVGEKDVALTTWPGCRVAHDDKLAVTLPWFTLGNTGPCVVVLDPKGRARFVGAPEAGLVDAVEAVLAGRDTVDAERSAATLRIDLVAAFDDATAAVADPLEQVVAHAPRDGLARGLLFLVLATKKNDDAAARKFMQESLAALANEARPLAAFADLALRGDPRRDGIAVLVRDALKPVAAAVPSDTFVQLTWLRTLVLTGDERETGRQSMKLRKQVTATASDCLDFASVLSQAANAPVHRDLATMAIEKAASLQATPRLLLAARYGVAARCANDSEAQKALLDEYLKDTEMRVSINNDCWYLMTELATMGRYDALAAGLADRMLEQKESMDYFEFDTAALAMFLVGRFADAVALQETAIEKGGKGNPEYTERLQRYQARLSPAPR